MADELLQEWCKRTSPQSEAFVEWTIGERNMEQSLPERLEHRLRYPDLQGAFLQMLVKSVQKASLQQ
jgi:hypothetical protein